MNPIKIDEQLGPTVRDLDIKVTDILDWLESGTTEAQIRETHPHLEQQDFAAVYSFAKSCVLAVGSVSGMYARIREDIGATLAAVRKEGNEKT